MIQKIKGTMDILPEQTPLFRYLEQVMREEAEKYGFGEIRTPTFENTALFVRGVGDTTDVVQKEMYTFTDRDENRSISLRPEGTASVVRALLENGRHVGAMPQKFYYIINCFRHEAPQAGRSREFFQFGTETFGAAAPSADANAIGLASAVFRRLGLENVRLHLNSIGCAGCRPVYRKALAEYYGAHEAELCDTCRTRLVQNPLRLLDCKVASCAALASGAPKTVDYLCPACRGHFETLCSLLDAMGLPYIIDPSIVRGLDYYTRTVFEFIAEGIAAQSTVCGGGRYDGLVESLGGPALPGIGFAMGLTRVILAMEQAGKADLPLPGPHLYIAPLCPAAVPTACALAERLRATGVSCEYDMMDRSLKAQMKYAGKIGAAYTLILGEEELATGRAQLRNMREGTQEEVELEGFTPVC